MLGATVLLLKPQLDDCRRSSDKNLELGYDGDNAACIIRESAGRLASSLVPQQSFQLASSTGGLISDHDLYILVDAARFWCEHRAWLAPHERTGLPPASYAFLDGFDTHKSALREAITADLPRMEIPQGDPSTWPLSPVLLGLPASPSTAAIAASVVDDHVLLSIHSCGQILSHEVSESAFRYALSCIEESVERRAQEVEAVQERVRTLVNTAQAQAQDDDYAYVRAVFDQLSRTVSYAEKGSSAHDNDVFGALVEGSARCYGLCGALKLALDARGIPNFIADGDKPSGRHSWNMVWVRNSWRVCDLTLMVDAREGTAGLSADPEHTGIYACLTPEHNFYAEHQYVLDENCQVLELVYSRLVSQLRSDPIQPQRSSD
ncbi:MAG: transglutaminase-like domain-containing protein [Coriobacteriales bacterium]|nr:transglutaminase-like domain-containing protein [Coriobacteriales bacterium]